MDKDKVRYQQNPGVSRTKALDEARGKQGSGRKCKEKGLRPKTEPFLQFTGCYLDFDNVRSLRSLVPLGHIEANPVSFNKRFETIALNGREVDENIGTPILLDETEPLGVIEPFYRAFNHSPAPLLSRSRRPEKDTSGRSPKANPS